MSISVSNLTIKIYCRVNCDLKITAPHRLTNETVIKINSKTNIRPKYIQLYYKIKEQQRIFNTFVRESINQLLGPDYMRTHDVQDIDAQVMEMIRSKP